MTKGRGFSRDGFQDRFNNHSDNPPYWARGRESNPLPEAYEASEMPFLYPGKMYLQSDTEDTKSVAYHFIMSQW